jgi:hypothetical protein
MPQIKTLRGSSRRLILEVQMGVAQNGSYVVCKVDLDRSSPEVEAAMAPMENLAIRLAQERVGQAINHRAIEKRAKELSEVQVQAANDRFQAMEGELARGLGRRIADKAYAWMVRDPDGRDPKADPTSVVRSITNEFVESHQAEQVKRGRK